MSAVTLMRVLRCTALLPLVVRQLLQPAIALPSPGAKLLHKEGWRHRHGQAALRMLPSEKRQRSLANKVATPDDIVFSFINASQGQAFTTEGINVSAMNTSQAQNATLEDINVSAMNTSQEQNATPEDIDGVAMNTIDEQEATPEDIDVAVMSISQGQSATFQDINVAAMNTSQEQNATPEDINVSAMNTSQEQNATPEDIDGGAMNAIDEQEATPEDIDVAVMSISQEQAATPEEATGRLDNETIDFERLRYKACLKQQAKIERTADEKDAKGVKGSVRGRRRDVQSMKTQVMADLDDAMQALHTVHAGKKTLLGHPGGVYTQLIETTMPCVNVSGTYAEAGPGGHKIYIQVEQTDCNISIFMRQMHHYGRIDGETVLVEAFKSDAHVRDSGDIAWSDGGYWSRQAHEDELQCEQADINLTAEEVMHAKCPAGRYLGLQSVDSHRERARRLQKALCASKAAGKVWSNTRGGQSFASHGYMTYESSIWPKRQECAESPEGGPAKAFEFNEDTAVAKAQFDKRLVYEHGRIEFRWVPRAASATLERFVECEVSSGRANVSNASFDKPPVVVASVRNPIDRFVSAANDVFERIVNHQCNDQQCNKHHRFTQKRLQAVENATTWYSFLTGLDTFGGNMHGLLQRLVHDTGCNYKYYASERMVTQAAAVSQLPGKTAPIDLLVKVENMEPGLKELTHLIHGSGAPPSECHVRPRNVADCVQSNDKLPTRHEIKEAVLRHSDLMRELCLIYAQDFVCFDYDLPPACSDLF